MFRGLEARCVASFGEITRSPSSALSHLFLGEGFSTKIHYRKNRVPTFLSSLLEDLDCRVVWYLMRMAGG